jgi:prepilin-type N-terminal cleavage/methylation domain-containing protein/prepilin-type processing-associated H-X9-DG protein
MVGRPKGTAAMNGPSRKAAFTLIELLVVIAIIAILAAILFPVFAQARDSARKASCLSNSKQMGLAIMMYTEDYDQIYPMGYYYELSGPTRGRRVQWCYNIQPYVKDQGIFKCLTDFEPTPPAKSSGYTDLTVPALSYIPNYAVMPAHDGGSVNSAAVGTVANVIILAEKQYRIGTKVLKSYAGTSGFWPDTPTGSDYCRVTADRVLAAIARPSDSNYKLARVAFYRHLGGSNFIFCDGHAKFHKLEQTLGPGFMWGELYYAGSTGKLLDEATCSSAMPPS